MAVELPRQIDFAIVGTAKSGTTSLSQLISYSANARVLQPKDSYFFHYLNSQPVYNGPKSPAALARIEEAKRTYPEQLGRTHRRVLVGDACVYSMYSQQAVDNIKRHLSSTGRIFVCLRRPDDRAFSAYMHTRRDGAEPLSFAEALGKEDERIDDNWVELWWYRSLGFYSDAVERLYDIFDRGRVDVIPYDELIDPQSASVGNALAKAGIILKRERPLPHLNPSGEARSRALQNILDSDSAIKARVKRLFPQRFLRRLRGVLQTANIQRQTMSADIKKELIAGYKPDIRRLERLTDLDLQHWTS